jgi:uncharacterized protein YecT (DUF1311 family)
MIRLGRFKIGFMALTGALALLGAPSGAWAQPAEPGNSAYLQDCLDHVIDNEHGSRWPAVIDCYTDEFNAQNRKLQEAWQALEAGSKRLGARAEGEAATGRRQWEAYRDSWCAFEQERFIKPNADVAFLSCKVDVTKAQLARVAEQVAVLH